MQGIEKWKLQPCVVFCQSMNFLVSIQSGASNDNNSSSSLNVVHEIHV